MPRAAVVQAAPVASDRAAAVIQPVRPLAGSFHRFVTHRPRRRHTPLVNTYDKGGDTRGSEEEDRCHSGELITEAGEGSDD